MKVFISYSLRDRELAAKFAKLLQLGAGVGVVDDDLFFSGDAGTIQNGTDFREQILLSLNSADMVVCLLSPSYFESTYCTAECGAALARKQAGKGEYMSFLVPPFEFSDLPQIVQGIQSGKISDSKALAALPVVIARSGTRTPGLQKWIQEVEDFLPHAEQARKVYEAEALAGRIAPKNTLFAFDEGVDVNGKKIYFKTKLRLIFENETGSTVEILKAIWEPAPGSLFEAPSPYLKWQTFRSGVWTREEPVDPLIQAGQEFRTYIGSNDLFKEKQLIRVIEGSTLNRLGTVTIYMTIGGVKVLRELTI